jgi:tryptophanyl-tRNA synthetase
MNRPRRGIHETCDPKGSSRDALEFFITLMAAAGFDRQPPFFFVQSIAQSIAPAAAYCSICIFTSLAPA